MSRPHTFTPPPCAHARQLRTPRGDFAVLDASPSTVSRGTALLLPGYTGSKEDFIALLEPLSTAGYRTVAVDGRGQYETDGTDRQESYAQGELARDVLAQAAALGAPDNGTVHLVGHSLGGQIARAAVLLDAAPFRSLTLMSSGPAEVAEAQQLKVKVLSDALTALTMAEVWEAMRALDPPEEAATDGEALRRRWLRHRPAQLIATGRQLATEPDRVAELAAAPLPVHVLSGERDDTWPVPLLDEMAQRLGARRTRIAGAEHSPNTDRPEETAAALVTFWNSL
ncbi:MULTISPECIES: alpha/beta fold hydrolase [unclassified Streptomyces]|uniref:alpha/beta fold hydrolase n=1 Tax=unclassified Streptomyces TaxID=2593676 RepID=UPI0022574DC9|nr:MULTISPECIES: alpha/beta fold hydrolase [unclassified Streptomyces]WSP57355.1 alpha/beta hydrolase [Streptomyces sp. NBC_01241]WSU21927.1 alpha/beta hydrolase [Streptomyces sp. NBC_01108]MCX4789176.1 alpha/beta hydrolase [Streptomyces sp. NBC_01221]MCX4795079.1 alpha/beta hydrolase [Streptomyces sp. NBC_01242]WSP62819.1 alpha/beta hydrolase [Streptomyces sp. NBC_01240]